MSVQFLILYSSCRRMRGVPLH